jgi:hypothetical protein
MAHTNTEATICTEKHILLCNNVKSIIYTEDLDHIKSNFCGNVFTDIESFNNYQYSSDTIIYLCGDIKQIFDEVDLTDNKIIKELSFNYENIKNYHLINLGEVPINIFNVGVYFRKFFNSDKKYYNSIVDEHKFQSLTESNKKDNAFRKGIYLTSVENNDNKIDDEKTDEIKFKLLRCSTNLSGPTDNFRETDNEIINKVNSVSQHFFENSFELNHVLAQTYHNTKRQDGVQKEKKAKISEHSDKTKDMPKNGLIAFCSFYKDYSNDKFDDSGLTNIKKARDQYDYFYKQKTSILTKLRFRLKKEVTDENMEKKFDVILYPNSVFLIPLSTNRLYTHEIIPSILPVDKIPTRMGYVIRCSNTDSVFKDNQTYIVKNKQYIKLEKPTDEGIKELKYIYLKENMTTEMVYYDKFHFSLNNGDYTKPIV